MIRRHWNNEDEKKVILRGGKRAEKTRRIELIMEFGRYSGIVFYVDKSRHKLTKKTLQDKTFSSIFDQTMLFWNVCISRPHNSA